MKVKDSTIVKWGNLMVKWLTLFAISYTCVMLYNVQIAHKQFQITQTECAEDNDQILMLISNHIRVAEEVLNQQKIEKTNQNTILKLLTNHPWLTNTTSN